MLLHHENIKDFISYIAKGRPSAIIRFRDAEDKQISARCQIARVGSAKKKGEKIDIIFFENFSEDAPSRLLPGCKAKVEIFLDHEKISFDSTVVGVADGAPVFSVPYAYDASKSRGEKRFKTGPGRRIFLTFLDYEHDHSDLASAPSFGIYQNLIASVRVVDISMGGFSLEVNFPSFQSWLEMVGFTENVLLCVPGRKPVKVAIEAVWHKRFRTRIKHSSFDSKRYFRTGGRFVMPSPEAEASIAHAIGFLSDMAEAPKSKAIGRSSPDTEESSADTDEKNDTEGSP